MPIKSICSPVYRHGVRDEMIVRISDEIRNRVQNYKKFCTYANFALIFYVNTGTMVVVSVNMDMKLGELIDIIEAFEVSA